ncbi:tetratricopeptide repeat protein [Pedobacter steynii]
MKKYFNLLFIFMLTSLVSIAQTVPPNMDKMMQDAMKGMSKEEQAEMKKVMKGVMPELMQNNSKVAYYPEFTNNAQLIPKKEQTKINALPKKKLTQADINGYATILYTKITAKGNAAEMAIAKKIIAQSPKANDISGAAILAMIQGHPQAAMALSIKAVQLNPANPSYQNNMASLLTQYGYPEQAIPILQKLRRDFPDNSTVMNNLAYTWLGLGEIDSAKAIIKKAGVLNPYHPESKEIEGVIEEAAGNSGKALANYEASMENAINPFTEQLLKNAKKISLNQVASILKN